jgi:hypothetical protein
VRARKREMGLGISAYVPQHHEIARAAEADFYEADVDFPWGRERVSIITLRSSFSGAALHVAYPRNNQSVLLEGIMLALEFLGGVFKIVRFDNLSEAVKKILKGGRRVERDRFVAFRSHYLFESSFCTPGIEGAHEKGGVEGEVGRFRRRHLTPVPEVSGYDELNSYLRACCTKDLARTIENKNATVGHDYEIERGFLKPLPAERFEIAEISQPVVDAKCRVRVRTNRYSVPASLVGATVTARVMPLEVEISYDGRVVAVHERVHIKNQQRLCLDHYLELLRTNPGAFPGALPPQTGPRTRRVPGVLRRAVVASSPSLARSGRNPCAHRRAPAPPQTPRDVVDEAVELAVELGTVDPGTIALIARNLRAEPKPPAEAVEVGELSRYDRAMPDTEGYDQLLAEVAR